MSFTLSEYVFKESSMKVNDVLRIIAGLFVITSIVLGALVHPYYYFVTAFVGLNLLQSGFTRRCPMITILKKLGLED